MKTSPMHSATIASSSLFGPVMLLIQTRTQKNAIVYVKNFHMCTIHLCCSCFVVRNDVTISFCAINADSLDAFQLLVAPFA